MSNTFSSCLAGIFAGENSAAHAGAQGPDLSRYVLVCALLIVAIAALAFGFRRLIASTVRAKAAGRSLQVIDMLPLGGKQKLCIVRCYDRTFALGLGDREMCLISELDPIAQRSPADSTAQDRAEFARTLEAARHEDGARASESTREKAVRRVQQLLRAGGLLG